MKRQLGERNGLATRFVSAILVCLFLGGCIGQPPNQKNPATPNSHDFRLSGASQIVQGMLDNPRGVAIGPIGEIYVADSGAKSVAYSGKVLRVAVDDTSTLPIVRITNITSAQYGKAYLFGLSDVATNGESIYAVLGLAAWIEKPLTGMNRLVYRNASGEITTLFDFDNLEQERDPAGLGADSNATGIALAPDGTIWVSDAAGNWVAHLTSNGSVISVTPFPTVDGEQAVPTGIAVGPDGRTYVTLLRCQKPTGAKGGVARINDDGTFDIVASGFSMPIDVAFDPSGVMYVLEFANDYAPSSGKLTRITSDKVAQVVLSQLNYPTSVAIDGRGRIYVVGMSNPAGGEVGSGYLNRYDPIDR